jgi:hypothetical protein
MADKNGLRRVLAVIALVLASVLLAAASRSARAQILLSPLQDLAKNVAVAAEAGWTDTGVDVAAGDTLSFVATGEINLQKGNPEAVCGPGGVDLITVDQPVPNANLGALIGKLAQTVAVRADKDSGAETVDEIFVLFVVGADGTFTAPFKGRIYLGVNENVLKDNAGGFSVVVTRRPG